MKFFRKGKKMIILSAMVVLLIVTAVVNVALSRSEPVNINTGGGGNEQQVTIGFFAGFRADRARLRTEQEQRLEATIADPMTSAAARLRAEEDLATLRRNQNIELNAEASIRALGFSDAVITTGDNFFHAVVQTTDALSSERTTAVANIVATYAQTDLWNVVVSRHA